MSNYSYEKANCNSGVKQFCIECLWEIGAGEWYWYDDDLGYDEGTVCCKCYLKGGFYKGQRNLPRLKVISQ